MYLTFKKTIVFNYSKIQLGYKQKLWSELKLPYK